MSAPVDVLAVRQELVERFAEAVARVCYPREIEHAIECGRPDRGAMNSWGLTEGEYWMGVRVALALVGSPA